MGINHSNLTSDQIKTIEMIEEVAEFLRSEWLSDENFEGWPGLPDEPASQPTLEGANYFFLGCCVDYQERMYTAWSKARRFCFKTVPDGKLATIWEWITDHSQDEWQSRYQQYALHRFPAAHQRVYRIANTLQSHFGGDPRNIWATGNVSRLPSILENDLAVGPAISRMIVGALRDHRLIDLQGTDFKPDRYVCRLMKSFGLSETEEWEDVCEAGKRCFADPWLVDCAFFHLGSDISIKTKEEFLQYYGIMKEWKRSREKVKQQVVDLIPSTLNDVETKDWGVHLNSSPHWIGFDLIKETGPLSVPMNEDNPCRLWAWLGVGFYGEIMSAIDIGGDNAYFTPPKVKQKLKSNGLSKVTDSPAVARGQREFWSENALSLGDLHNQRYVKRSLRENAQKARDIVSLIEKSCA